MPLVLEAPCLNVSELSASPGFSYGRPGDVSALSFLNRPGGTPSNNTGVNFGLNNGVLEAIATGTRTADTYGLTIFQHDGNFASPTTIAIVSITALTKAVLVGGGVDFTQLAAIVKNRQIAVQVSSGTCNNIGVDLQLTGDVN